MPYTEIVKTEIDHKTLLTQFVHNIKTKEVLESNLSPSIKTQHGRFNKETDENLSHVK